MVHPLPAGIARRMSALVAGILLCATSPAKNGPIHVPSTRAPARGVVVILMDDVAYDDLGCNGHPSGFTPQIDRFASEGVNFSRAYATAATCSPSRAAILTGRYQQRFGYEFNPQHRALASQGLDPKETTIARRLSLHGFKTGVFGKWHLGFGISSHPMSNGFGEFYGFLSGSRSYHAYTGKRSKRQNEFNRMLLGREPVEEDFDYLTTELGHRAADFIGRHAEEEFFLYLSFSAIHSPFHPDPDLEVELPEGIDEERGVVLQMLASMDRAIGEVLGALDENGRRDDTLVMILSDNGGRALEGSDNWELMGEKGELLEGGVRVPMILRWPERLPAGLAYHKNVSTLDVVPTILAATGVRRPAGLDGVNLMPFARRHENPALQPHPILFWRQGEQWAVLAGDDKIVDLGEGPFYRDLGAPDLGIVDVSEAELGGPLRGRPIAELLTAHEAWAQELVEPGWRKFLMDRRKSSGQ